MYSIERRVFYWISLILGVIFFANARIEDRIDCPAKCICLSRNVRCTMEKPNWIPRVPRDTAVLDLRYNSISILKPDSLRGLDDLYSLLLNENQLRYLGSNVFKGAPYLRTLHLYKNRIESIEPGAFAGLRELEQLYLQHNRLTEIKKGTFNDLPALQRLFLQNNRLHRLPADAFLNVGPMTRLRLDGNELVCDCHLAWLVERSQNSSKETEIAAICQSPKEMKGRSLSDMTTDEFHCTKPSIMEGPKDVNAKLGDTVISKCRVSGDPIPDVKWMRDSNEVSPDGERYTIREDGSLIISLATEKDNGEYECVAISEMGSIKSRRALITVSPLLKFVELPRSKTVRVGADVTFVCRVDEAGYDRAFVDQPLVHWWKNGQRLTTAERITINEDGSVLRILAVKESDDARYVCRAKNADGFAETSADLRVLSADFTIPKLTYRPLERMDVENGVSIELPCRAEGHPKPIVQWKKDGSAVESGRSRLSKGGSLYLYNVTIQDSGRYECSAINENGRATGQTVLRVQRSDSRDILIIKAFHDATEEIDRAINRTLTRLFNNGGSHHSGDLFRLSRFPDAVGRAVARPAELFERTLTNIRRMIDAGITANVTNKFRYEDILTTQQIKEIEKLSGCTGHRSKRNCTNTCYHKKYRTTDGSCNNLHNPTWGSSYTGFRRILTPIYENGFSSPIGWEKDRRYYGYPKPAARLISTTLISTHDITSDDRITHMVMQWGQFLDHDLDHALPSVSSESWDGIDCKKSCDNAAPCFPMEVPPGDPRIANRRCIDFIRTSAVCGSGMTSVLWGDELTPREQLNQLTSYLDASQVYGYDDALAKDLRDLSTDHGLLREGPTVPGRKALLPYMRAGQFVDCRRDPLESAINCFVAGDIRANEQVGLLAMHTIWLREHNRIARRLRDMNPHWNGEKIYQEARRIVGAEMQHISFQHWLPSVLGGNVDALVGPYRGYNPNSDASVSNVFATAALRFGHSLIQPRLERLNESFQSIPQGPLNLRDAFFSPWRLVDEGGVDPLIRGMFATPAKLKLPEQNLNVELTEQLFRTAHAVALDLAAMNIQRGREHGIPGYLEWRKFCNMSPVESFEDLSAEISSPRVRQKLRELYGHPGNIDVWVGGILEDQLPGAKVGPLFKCLLLEQFARTRDGDRFWYESASLFKSEQLAQIKQASLARILCDNGDNINRIQPNVFYLPVGDNSFVDCDSIPYLDLQMWSDCCDNCEDRDDNRLRFIRAAKKYTADANNGSYDLEQRVKDLKEAFDKTKKQSGRCKRSVNALTDRIEKLEKFLKERFKDVEFDW